MTKRREIEKTPRAGRQPCFPSSASSVLTWNMRTNGTGRLRLPACQFTCFKKRKGNCAPSLGKHAPCGFHTLSRKRKGQTSARPQRSGYLLNRFAHPWMSAHLDRVPSTTWQFARRCAFRLPLHAPCIVVADLEPGPIFCCEQADDCCRRHMRMRTESGPQTSPSDKSLAARACRSEAARLQCLPKGPVTLSQALHPTLLWL